MQHASHRRGRAVVGAVLLLTAACGSGRPAAERSTYGGDAFPSASSTTVPTGGAPTTSPTGGRSPAGGGRPSQSSAATSAPRSGTSGSATSSGDGTVVAAKGPPGAFAPYLLRPAPNSQIVVETLAQAKATPDAQALDHVTSVLRSVSAKTVDRTGPFALAGGARSWDSGTISSMADSSTRQAQGGGQAVLHLLYLHGTFNGDSSVLGVAVRGDVLAIFVDQLQSSASITLPESELEDVVTMHETGHILGLVDLYLHTGRQDPQHPGHSTNRRSVMYWAVDSSLIGQILGGNPPKDFDSDDLHDLQTIKSGA